MLLIKVALVASSFVIFTTAQDADAGSKGLTPGRGRTPNPSVSGKLMTKRDLTKRCEGTCVACFGAGYTECPNSDLYCYLPGDSTYGLNSCYGDGSSSGDTTATASAPSSTSTGTAGADDICQQKGSTCVSCFGPTYLQCPDGYHCYDPNDPKYDTCPDGSSSSSGGSSSGGGGSNTTATSCANLYGVEHIPCGTDACYDPDKGESCCAEGYYCSAGYTCSTTVGKCSHGGSSGGGSSLTTSSHHSSSPTSTSGLLSSNANTGLSTATNTRSTSSVQTSVNSVSGADGLLVGPGMAFVVVGLGMLVF